jgi:SecD/SecF fusion protein
MKTIFNFIITSLICIILVSAIQKTTERTKSITLQPVDSKVTSQVLVQSAKIITDRLKTYGLGSSVSVVSEKGQITVKLPDNINISEIKGLLTLKGQLGFYKTLTLNEINDLLKNGYKQLTNDFKSSPSDARIGCSTFEDQNMVDTILSYLNQINLKTNFKLCWGVKDNQSMTCLYALQTNSVGNPPLGRTDLEKIGSTLDKDSQTYTIDIKFKPESVKVWAQLTRESLNKPVAVVIDEKVYSAPVVKTSIESGLCEITGSLTQKDVNYLLALLNNELLPVNFVIR